MKFYGHTQHIDTDIYQEHYYIETTFQLSFYLVNKWIDGNVKHFDHLPTSREISLFHYSD